MTYLAYFQQNAKNKILRCSLLLNKKITKNDVYYKINEVTNVPAYSRLKQDCMKLFLQASLRMLLKLASKIWCQLSEPYKDMTLYPRMYQNACCNLLQKKTQYIGMAFIY